ncbi:MAG: hypothetical protein WC796_05915 [Candidatus Pacearchaeota archaeon]|jgi:D-alanine-D-alanine ligase
MTKNIVVILGDPRKSDGVIPGGRFTEDELETHRRLKSELERLGDYSFSYLDDHDRLVEDLKSARESVHLAMNLCDNGYMNDPKQEAYIPRMLEDLGIPYTGAGAECMVLCYDKTNIRKVAGLAGISTSRGFVIDGKVNEGLLEYPLIVKPAQGDGGFGITKDSVVKNREGLERAVEILRGIYSGKILVEEFLGGDEITLGMVGNSPNFTVFPPIKEDFSRLPEGLPKICGYESKWDFSSPYLILGGSLTAELEESARQKIIVGSKKLFEITQCRDYARFDWRLDSRGNPNILEVNPNPGWCWDGHLAKGASAAGISYGKMLEMIIQSAEERLGLSNQ